MPGESADARRHPGDAHARREKLGVNSTPTFFINGKIFRGALTMEELDKQIAPYLKADKGFFACPRAGTAGGRERCQARGNHAGNR